MTTIALCQIPVSPEPSANLKRVREALARAEGADLAIFPEATLTRFGGRVAGLAEPLDGPFVTGLSHAAREHGVAVIAGVFEPGDGGGRVHNTAVAIDAEGSIRAAYRKIHLFDSFGAKESELVAPGSRPTVVELAGLRIGLITCYDVRFPELARALVDEGADLFAVIAAWGSGPLKEDHWVTLVRARALENTMWTAAVGQAPNPAESSDGFGVGRSMLVDPLGVVRVDLGTAPGVQLVRIDPEVTAAARAALPCLEHRVLKGQPIVK
ncbi:carbon-nitrogen hydrolase family protein [Nonomuraea pusilla]|uniref:Predicted amidohydrolase n=1 Tax=Nonomuraea pusilla TaxID=46177 RepID=A0A1H7LAX2_9ACTN|nr:carbon-nitrogen hydrolase family protein [Nonomuraea pusilla]SEK95645.1 Predicted amidohydrolase [Nonomuraea pusilla]